MISIVIPVYNVAPYIEQCLESVAKQTYNDLEVILVDDCGTDDSIRIAERFIRKHQQFNSFNGNPIFRIVHHENNRGLSASRNTGIDSASGDYLCFLDSDDFIDSTMVEKFYGELDGRNNRIISCGCWAFKDGNLSVYRKEWNHDDRRIIKPMQYAEMMLPQHACHTAWGKLFPKVLFDKVRFREGVRNEDTLFALDAYPIVEKLRIETIEIPDRLYYYRQRSGSICNSDEIKFTIEELNNFDIVLDSLPFSKRKTRDTVLSLYMKKLYWAIISTLNVQTLDLGLLEILLRKIKNIPLLKAFQEFPFSDFKSILLLKFFPGYYISRYHESR